MQSFVAMTDAGSGLPTDRQLVATQHVRSSPARGGSDTSRKMHYGGRETATAETYPGGDRDDD